MLSPLNKRRNFNKNEVNAELFKIEFKNINIDVQTFKKIYTLYISSTLTLQNIY